MKAITLKENGGVENFNLSDVNMPETRSGEVLVQIKAIGINPVDTFVRRSHKGMLSIMKPAPGEDTFILGWDISGTITALADDAVGFKVGDDVFGMVNFVGSGKAYAEYTAAPASHLALKPANISHEEAAAASLAAITAWQALVNYAKVSAGEKVLIHSGSGGVGHYAIQIAKYLGAFVISTSSAANRDFVLSLGADEWIDYAHEKFEDKVKDADVVLDSLAGEHLLRSLDAVKQGGRLISLVAHFTDENVIDKVKEKDVYAHRLGVTSNGEDMKKIAALLADGTVRSQVSKTFPLAEMAAAHTEVETGKTTGKVVVTV